RDRQIEREEPPDRKGERRGSSNTAGGAQRRSQKPSQRCPQQQLRYCCCVEFSGIEPALTSTCRAMDSGRHATATKGSTLPSVDPPLSGAKRPRDNGPGGEAAEGIVPESAPQHHAPQQLRQQQPAISSKTSGRDDEETGGGGRASSPKCGRGLPAAAKKAPGTPGAAAAAAASPSPTAESATAAAAGAAKPVPFGETVEDGPNGAEAGSTCSVSASNVAEAPAVLKCQVCGEKERRYCCPRCGKLTCSLPCYKRHKKEEGCNGKRDKVSFVGLQEFTDAHLRSDFNFLEDAMRCVDGGRRELARRPGVFGTPSKQQRNA
ncbi:unnamed protein product, partial [Ectocarpus sp. 4 AP-2014]